MDLSTLIPLFIKISILLIVFGLGLEASWRNAFYLFRKPGLLLRSLLAMNFILPVVVGAMVAIFPFHQSVGIALITLAVSPIPPILPKKQYKVGGDASYVIGLLVAVSLLSIVVTPGTVEILGWAFAKEAYVSPLVVAKLVLLTVLVPLGLGLLVRALAPGAAVKMVKPVSLLGMLMLAAGVLPILIKAWPAIVALIGDGSILAIAGFVLVGLVAGHLLGGPNPGDRSTLALSAAIRHPGVAMAVAAAVFPDQKKHIMAAILLYLLVSAVVALPYLSWCRKRYAVSHP